MSINEELRREVWRANLRLASEGLVVWTGGNVSARDPETQIIYIKPSGVDYSSLQEDDIAAVDPDGAQVHGKLKPSVDTVSHVYIYKHMPKVQSVVHTHSTFAAAFAAVGRAVPAVLTSIADEFGGEIPCGGFAPVGGEDVGRAVCEAIAASPAVLLRNHGLFAVGETVKDALRAAVMAEDAARTVYYAETLGTPIPLSPEEIKAAHKRYVEKYGQ